MESEKHYCGDGAICVKSWPNLQIVCEADMIEGIKNADELGLIVVVPSHRNLRDYFMGEKVLLTDFGFGEGDAEITAYCTAANHLYLSPAAGIV